jgi:hypothetical protein
MAETVLVKSVQWHTYHGVAQPVGANYQAAAEDVATLDVQHFAVPVEELTAIEAPPPTVTALEPATAAIGQPSFTLHVRGTGFVPGAVIVFNGYDEPTALVSATEVTTGVNMTVWTAPSAPLPVLVRNANGKSSAPLTFTFTAAAR